MKKYKKSIELGERTLTFEVGKLAQQATSSVLASYGETMILVTVVAATPREDLGYFPLNVQYIERLYAGGRIKGSRWVKREGRPSDESILAARLIDRSVRPLFPEGYTDEVQVMVTILSVDGENDPDILAINAVSAALAISPIPWNGPVAAIRLGYVPPKNGERGHFLINPTESEKEYCDMDLVATATASKIHMIETKARQVAEDIFLESLQAAKVEAGKVIEFINELTKEVGQKKNAFVPAVVDKTLLENIRKQFKKELEELYQNRINKAVAASESEILVQPVDYFKEKYNFKQIREAFDYLVKTKIRNQILDKEIRPDGRKLTEIRPIEVEVGVLPRTHGSALFSRGETQVLTVATLGSPALEQLIESATGEESKRYIHHYNMPPYSVGETGRTGWPSRREVGHGALAEKGLEVVIPSEEKFPYTIRLVSEVMSSNGSTSMASICGSTLALMDAGVPISNPVAGISIGLVTKGKDYKLLTDIAGLEDFTGDMDFKIAGSKEGITAVQLDVKIEGLTDEMIAEAVARAKTARMEILTKMLAVMPTYRPHLSQYAPKVELVKVPQEKIGEIIGPGGKVIRKIIADTGATVDVNDEGEVTISATDAQSVEKAKAWVMGLIKEVQAGEEFEGEVKRIVPFGAFVEILPGKDGLVHVSQLSDRFVNDPAEVVNIGDKVRVRVREVDDQGRINLTMKSQNSRQFPRPPARQSSFRGRGRRESSFRHR